MASYLATVVVGQLTFEDAGEVGGVTIRNVYADSIAERRLGHLRAPGRDARALRGAVRPLPVRRLRLGGRRRPALRRPGDPDPVDLRARHPRLPAETESVVAHELAHQWFGDAVTPDTWQDIWLNEGFATYAEWLWVDHAGGNSPASSMVAGAHQSLQGDEPVAPGDPGAEDLFHTSVYWRGALALHALRETVGDDDFFAILQTWVERNDGASVNTADFVALAEEVSGDEVSALMDAWLYDPEMPDLP